MSAGEKPESIYGWIFTGGKGKLNYGFTYLGRRRLANPYKKRSVDPENSTMLVDLILHASNAPPKLGLSTTVSPDLLFKVVVDKKTKETRARFKNEEAHGEVFVIKTKKKDLVNQLGSKWRNQFEVYLKNSYGTINTWLRKIKKKRVLRQNALFSFSKILKTEKTRKNRINPIKDISPRMSQIFMA